MFTLRRSEDIFVINLQFMFFVELRSDATVRERGIGLLKLGYRRSSKEQFMFIF